MGTSIRRAAVALLLSLSCAGPELAAQRVTVGTKDTPPFAVRGADGAWTGVTIELWQEMTRQPGFDYDIVERDLDGLLEGLRGGTLDAVAGALTVTAPGGVPAPRGAQPPPARDHLHGLVDPPSRPLPREVTGAAVRAPGARVSRGRP